MATKAAKYVEYAQSLVKRRFQEKKYSANGVTLKYIFEKASGSKELCIVFSACTRVGIPARYNYMRTLKDVNCNKLFILDDFGADHRGGFYLGAYPEFSFEKTTKELIDTVIRNRKIERCYFCGSSKGAWASLNFGLQYNDSVGDGIIIGAPQYWLGKYLSAPANLTTLDSMRADSSREEAAEVLDGYLKAQIENCSSGRLQKIYLHYSNMEHTYDEHIRDLIEELKRHHYVIEENIGDYTDHWDVSLYYPDYLVNRLTNCLNSGD